MDEAHKELVKRLRAHFRSVNASGVPCMTPRNPDGEEAADALEALAGEAERLTNEVAKERGNADQNSMQRDKARAERDRLKAALEQVKHLSRLRISEREDAIHQTARKALGGAS